MIWARVTIELKAELEAIAAREERTLSNLMLVAAKELVERRKK